jgi:hypothetical protein
MPRMTDRPSSSPGALVRRALSAALALGGCVALFSILSALFSGGKSPSWNAVLVVMVSLPYGVFMFGSYAIRGRLPFSGGGSSSSAAAHPEDRVS